MLRRDFFAGGRGGGGFRSRGPRGFGCPDAGCATAYPVTGVSGFPSIGFGFTPTMQACADEYQWNPVNALECAGYLAGRAYPEFEGTADALGGAFSDASNDVSEAANTLIRQIEDLYLIAMRSTRYMASTDNIVQAQSALQEMWPQIEDWGSTKLDWVLSGSNGPNRTYDWNRWFADGRQYADIIMQLTSTVQDMNYLNQLRQASGDIGSTIQAGLTALARIVPKIGAALEATVISLPLILGLGFLAFMYAKGR